MKIASCKNCGKLFDDIIGYGVCPECRFSESGLEENKEEKNYNSRERLKAKLKFKEDEEEKKFEELKEFIFYHPKATILDISTTIKVSPSLIIRWVREGRIEFSDDSKDAWFECENCGTKIKSGNICATCRCK